MERLSIGNNSNSSLKVYSGTYGSILFSASNSISEDANASNIHLSVDVFSMGRKVTVIPHMPLSILRTLHVTREVGRDPKWASATEWTLGTAEVDYELKLPQVIEVKGSDYVQLNVTTGSVATAPSITCALVKDIGIMDSLPGYRVFQIPDGQANYVQSLGDGIQSCFLINGSDNGQRPVSLQLTSDKLSETYSGGIFDARVASDYDNLTNFIGQFYPLFDYSEDDIDLNDVKINLTLPSGADNDWIVCETPKTDSVLAEYGARVSQKVSQKNFRKFLKKRV